MHVLAVRILVFVTGTEQGSFLQLCNCKALHECAGL